MLESALSLLPSRSAVLIQEEQSLFNVFTGLALGEDSCVNRFS